MRAMLLAIALLPLGASACDPDEMDRAMSEICTAATAAAAEVVQAATPLAIGEEAAVMAARLDHARHICINADPSLAAAEAVHLARFAARIEARLASKDDKR
jgi:hypothetical protein